MTLLISVVLALVPTVWASAEGAADRLGAGAALSPGADLVSPNGQWVLTMQADGNLTLAQRGRPPRWSTGTKQAGSVVEMQRDGNLVVYAPGHVAVWASGTDGVSGATLEVQDDGNVVVYRTGHRAAWSSGSTAARSPASTVPTQEHPDGDAVQRRAASSTSSSGSRRVRFPGHNELCTIVGTAGPDVLYGTAGKDVVCALAGDDTVYGAGGEDEIFGGLGNDELHGGDASDTIYGDEGDDVVYGRGGDDTIYADHVTVSLNPQARGRDTVYGGAGNDGITAGPGDDLVNTGSSTVLDIADGGAGDDVLVAGGPSWDAALRGDDGDDVLFPFPARGSPLGNHVIGGNGSDLAILANGMSDGFTAGRPFEKAKIPIGSACSVDVSAVKGKAHELSCSVGGSKGKIGVSVGTDGKVAAKGELLDGLGKVGLESFRGKTEAKLGGDTCACDPPISLHWPGDLQS